MQLLILFAHFDPEDRIRDYIVFHLKALFELGSVVVFITTSKPDVTECDRIRPYVSEIVFQPHNVGYDFYAWGTYLTKHRQQVQAVDQLILTNSSLLGPVAPLSSVIEKMADHSIWGMTENFHPRHHVQSYFLAFKKDVLQRTFFWDFFSNIIPFATMSSVINAYETTWADYFATQGFLPAIVAPPELGLEYRRTKIAQLFRSQSYKTYPVDPCFFYPEELVMAGVPYVKVKLFQGNNHNRNLHRMMAYVVNAGVTVNDFPALSKFVD